MKGLNTFTLKMIAISSMLIDHIGHVLFPEILFLRIIGRISFPIFAYVLAEGIYYTKDMTKYMLRLGIFALLSEIPYDLAIMGSVLEFTHQNVFFTLFFGVLMVYVMSQMKNIIVQYVVVFATIVLCQILHTDYSSVGILMIFIFCVFRKQSIAKFLTICLVLLGLTSGVQLYALLALPLIAMHNGEQGPKRKTFFYLFYPAHLLILYLVDFII